jgi:hypothetical protein
MLNITQTILPETPFKSLIKFLWGRSVFAAAMDRDLPTPGLNRREKLVRRFFGRSLTHGSDSTGIKEEFLRFLIWSLMETKWKSMEKSGISREERGMMVDGISKDDHQIR